MAVKTITITEEAYHALADLKRPGESFSEVIKRLSARSSWRDFVGILSPEQAGAMERGIRDVRRRADREAMRRSKRLKR